MFFTPFLVTQSINCRSKSVVLCTFIKAAASKQNFDNYMRNMHDATKLMHGCIVCYSSLGNNFVNVSDVTNNFFQGNDGTIFNFTVIPVTLSSFLGLVSFQLPTLPVLENKPMASRITGARLFILPSSKSH